MKVVAVGLSWLFVLTVLLICIMASFEYAPEHDLKTYQQQEKALRADRP